MLKSIEISYYFSELSYIENIAYIALFWARM